MSGDGATNMDRQTVLQPRNTRLRNALPLLFFASGFLAPLHSNAGEQLQTASADMLRRTLRAIARQWRGRLDKARQRGADLAGVAVALMLDAGDAAGTRRIELIARGLDTAERPAEIAPALPAMAAAPALEASATPVALDGLDGSDAPQGLFMLALIQ
jgi:uncharacterized membrane protein